MIFQSEQTDSFLWHEDQWDLHTECCFWSRCTDCCCIIISLFSVWHVYNDGHRSKDVGCSWIDTLCNLVISKKGLSNPLARELSKKIGMNNFILMTQFSYCHNVRVSWEFWCCGSVAMLVLLRCYQYLLAPFMQLLGCSEWFPGHCGC